MFKDQHPQITKKASRHLAAQSTASMTASTRSAVTLPAPTVNLNQLALTAALGIRPQLQQEEVDSPIPLQRDSDVLMLPPRGTLNLHATWDTDGSCQWHTTIEPYIEPIPQGARPVISRGARTAHRWQQATTSERTTLLPAQPGDALQETAYGFRLATTLPFTEAVKQVTASLKTHGFGVLTKVDVRATLKQKMNIEWTDYVILGVCNPPLAHQALSTETELGLLLPCNVIIYAAEDGRCVVSAIDPQQMMEVVGNPDLEQIAREATRLLRAALLMLLSA